MLSKHLELLVSLPYLFLHLRLNIRTKGKSKASEHLPGAERRMCERRESLPRSTAPSRLQAHRPTNLAHSPKQSRGISNVPPPGTWVEGEGRREGSFRRRDTRLCPYGVRDGMTQRGAMPASPYHPWGQWQHPCLSPCLRVVINKVPLDRLETKMSGIMG